MILKYTNSLLVGIFALILMVGFSSALAVSGSGWIEVYPGQNADISFDLMNLGEETSDIVIEASVLRGAEIVSISGISQIDVPAGTYVNFPVRVQVPSDAQIGAEYPAAILFRTVEVKNRPGEVGGAQLVFNVEKVLNIKVVEKPAVVAEVETQEVNITSNVWLWVIAVVVIIIILWLLLRKKKSDM